MVEYRQRLRVMLCATQGKYELQKSSGSIANEINYIYYFTYFYKFEVHPFWEEFNKKIQGSVSKLTTNIESLQKSHHELKASLKDTHQNISDLIKSIENNEKAVETSIVSLKYHIKEQVEKNKEAIQQTIKHIEKKITDTNKILKMYIEMELVKFKHLHFKINYSIQTIPDTIRTISFHIRKIMCLLALSRKITYTLKVHGQLTSKGTKNLSVDSYELNYKFESSETIEQVDKLEEIVQQVDCITDSIKQIQASLSLRSVGDLKAENLCTYLEKIKHIEDQLKPFQEKLCKLEGQKFQIKEIIKKLTEATTTIDGKYSGNYNLEFSLREGGSRASQNSEAQSNYVVTITKTIVCCNEKIKEYLENVGKQINELEEHIKKLKEESTSFKQQLKDLQVMKVVSRGLSVISGFNQGLKAYITQFEKDGKLDLSEIIQNLLSAKTSVEEIRKIINKICPGYLLYVNLMKIVVSVLLVKLSSKNGSKAYLNLARSGLYFIMCRLTELLRLGENILNLSYPIIGIRELKVFQREKMKELQCHKKKLEPFRDNMNGYVKTLDNIGCRIEKIYDLKDKLLELSKLDDLSKLQDMPQNLQTINELYTSIVTLNLGIEGLGSKEFLEGLKTLEGVVGGKVDGLSKDLKQIKDKLSEANKEYSEKIIERFKKKVEKILTQCSKRLESIGKTEFEQKSICLTISTCITHANGLIFISNFRTCKELNKLDKLLPDLRTNLKSIDTCVKCVTTLCQPDEVCKCISASVNAINSSRETGEKVLEAFDNCIEALLQKKKEIDEKRKQISNAKDQITGKLKDTKDVLVRLCRFRGGAKFSVDCLELHFREVTDKLSPFLDKVKSVICTLGKEIEHLESQLETTKTEVKIFLDFKSDVDREVDKMKGYIEAIKEAGKKISDNYSKYTSAFTAFNEALNKLETCLDYLIRDFLRCSLCTTVYRLKRQLKDTTWECPETECNSCLGSGVMTDKVLVLQTSLHKYVFSLLGHFSTLDTKVFISKLYRCIVRVDQIVRIVQVVDCCCCVKGFTGLNNDDQAVKTVNPKTCMMKYRQYVDYVKKNKETQLKAATLDTLGDSDNLNHLCLCLAIRYKMYPCILKTVTLLVQLELGVSGNIARKIGTHSKYDSYNKHSLYNNNNKHSGFNNYTQDSGCNSHNLSLSMMLVLSTWVMIKLASFLERRYKIEHDKVKCCTNDKADSKCDCETNKNGGSPPKNCCPCCGCHKATEAPPVTDSNSGTKPTVTPTTPTPCCCNKDDGSNGCRQTKCNKDKSEKCCCKCCCYCVCKNKTQCKCECEPEQHCFCSKHKDDCFYRWFIYVILYICHLVDDAFSLGHWDIQHAMQLLSNLLSKLDAVCWEADRRCVTISDKTSGEGDIPAGTAGQQTEVQTGTTPEAQPDAATTSVVVEEVITHSREHSSVSSSKVPGSPNVSLSLERSISSTSAMSVSTSSPKPDSLNGKKPCCKCDSICNLCVNSQALYRVITMARQTFYWVSKPILFSRSGFLMGARRKNGSVEKYLLSYYMYYFGPIINKITVTYYRVFDELRRLSLNECQSLYLLQFVSELSFMLLTHESINPVTGNQIRYVLNERANRYMSLLEVKPKPGEQQENQCLTKNCSICKKHKVTIPLLTGLQKVLNSFIEGTNSGSNSGGINPTISDPPTKDLDNRCKCENCCLICLQSGDIVLFITDLVEAIESYSKETKTDSSELPKGTIASITKTLSVTTVMSIQKNTKCQCTLVFAYFKYLLDVLQTRRITTSKAEPTAPSTPATTTNVTTTTSTPTPPAQPATPTPAPTTQPTAQGTNGTTNTSTATTTTGTATPNTQSTPTPTNGTKTVTTEIKGEPVIFVGLRNIMDSFFDKDYFKCGCESVVKCCCCCKCEECGNGKSRKCNEKGCGHGNSNGNGQGATSGSQTSGGGGSGQAANGSQGNCPCIKEGETEKQCRCKDTGAGEKKCCNCTKAGEVKTPQGGCQCCCFSCCADKENEDEKQEEETAQPQQAEQGQQQTQQPQQASEKNCPCKKKKKKKPKVHCKNNKKYKDKRCCCKCCPKENGTTNGGTATTNGEEKPANGKTNPNEKDCCCCCQCKTTCKGGASGSTSGGGSSSKCQCPNGMKAQNGKHECRCYCCFECKHEKSALKSICKQLAYDVKSSISVLSKMASNLTIECLEKDQEKLCYPPISVGQLLHVVGFSQRL